MWVKKKTAGVSSSGHEWENDGATVWVPDEVGLELVTHHRHEFSEDTDRDTPEGQDRDLPQEAADERAAREVTERAREHYRASEGVGTTRLADGRLAQTDTKSGDYTQEVRDTGNEEVPEEMGPANINRRKGHPRATVSPGSTENKADLTGYAAEDPRGRAEAGRVDDPRKPLSARVGDEEAAKEESDAFRAAKPATAAQEDKAKEKREAEERDKAPSIPPVPESKPGK